MKLKQLFTDDDSAVSPVIGVILMVAITVILAAVIATFVLGLGEQVSQTTPNANFQADWNSSGNTDPMVTITHTSGPSLDNGTLSISGDADVSVTANLGGDSQMSAGDSWDVKLDTGSLNEGDVLRLVWENDQGESAVLRTFEAPNDY